jgi:hypothetical protein
LLRGLNHTKITEHDVDDHRRGILKKAKKGGRDSFGVYSVAESDKLEVAFVKLLPLTESFIPLFIVHPAWHNRSPKCLMYQSGISIRKNEFSKEREGRCWWRKR